MKYLIKITTAGACRDFAEKCREILLSERVEVVKNSKSGEKTVDIRPLIRDVECDSDGESVILHATLSADQSAFLNPELIIKVLRDAMGILSGEDMTAEYYSVLRISAHVDNMDEFR